VQKAKRKILVYWALVFFFSLKQTGEKKIREVGNNKIKSSKIKENEE